MGPIERVMKKGGSVRHYGLKSIGGKFNAASTSAVARLKSKLR